MIARLLVESLVHGGEGLAHHLGRVVFVSGAAPGDLVEVELSVGPGRYQHARALRVVQPGPARVEAPCPIVERCGGCPLQHTSYPAQLLAKSALLRDALERIGGLRAHDLPSLPLIVPSPRTLRYRRRARLHRGPQGQWGFNQGGRVEPVAECLLFEPALQELADRVRQELAGAPEVLDLGLDTSDSGQGAVDLRTSGPPTPGLRRRARELLERVGSLRGVTLGPLHAPELLGEPVLADRARPFRLRSRPDLFAQANRSAVPLLQAAVLAALGEAPEVLELFGGAGTLTLPLLSRGTRVTCVEQAGPSLALLRKSADELGQGKLLRLIAGDAARVELGPAPAAVLLDPPRTGAAALMPILARLGAGRIVYVSCDAPTLGRDAKLLVASGYQLLEAGALDLFPQTAHFEVVATFVRR